MSPHKFNIISLDDNPIDKKYDELLYSYNIDIENWFIKNRKYKIIVPDDYSSIQSALENASTNDCIYVRKGTYKENIYWPDTFGIRLIGEDKNLDIDTLDIQGDVETFEISSTGTDYADGRKNQHEKERYYC